MQEIDKIHFQSRDHKVLFRKLLDKGTYTYTMEDYNGNVIKESFEPEINFNIWTIRQVESLLGEYGIVGAIEVNRHGRSRRGETHPA